VLVVRGFLALLFLAPVLRRHRVLVLGVLLLVALEAVGVPLFSGGHPIRGVLLVWLVAAALTIAAAALLSSRLERRRRLRQKTLESFLALAPGAFESAVCDLLHDLGYRDVQRVGKPGDLSADIICRDGKKRLVVVQCKRRAPGMRVSSPDIQSFIGMLSVHHKADAGIFVTTSEFTAPARELAKQHGLRLIDGTLLGRLATSPASAGAALQAE
jgi:restriction system protein